MNEPNEKALDRDEVADLPESFFWRVRAIQPENDDVEPDTTKDEPGLMTTIRITKEQLDKQPRCAVCLDDFVIKQEAMKLLCDHVFHEECITHWIIMHGTCPVCRSYYCPGELHLPQEPVSPPVNPTVAQRLYRTICSPLAHFFTGLFRSRATANNTRLRPHWPTPMFRILRAERVTSAADRERIENETRETTEDYVFCHVMFVMQNSERVRYSGSASTMAERMRNRFSRLHRLPADDDDDDDDDVGPLPERPQRHRAPRPAAGGRGFEMPVDATTTEYLGHY